MHVLPQVLNNFQTGNSIFKFRSFELVVHGSSNGRGSLYIVETREASAMCNGSIQVKNKASSLQCGYSYPLRNPGHWNIRGFKKRSSGQKSNLFDIINLKTLKKPMSLGSSIKILIVIKIRTSCRLIFLKASFGLSSEMQSVTQKNRTELGNLWTNPKHQWYQLSSFFIELQADKIIISNSAQS